MGNTYTIINQKGGAGKTTLTHNLGCALAVEHNKKVLFIDIDGQANLTTAFGFDPDDVNHGTYHIFAEKRILTKDFIHKTEIPNAFLIPSSQDVFLAETELLKRPGGNFALTDAIDQVKEDYDFIFVDVPPSLNVITLNALIASKDVILVYTASDFSLDGLSQVLNTIDDIQGNKRLNVNDTKIVGAVLNRYRIVNKTVNREMQEALNGVTDIPKYFTPISDTTEIEKAQFEHKPVTIYSPRHRVSEQFRKFANELLELCQKD